MHGEDSGGIHTLSDMFKSVASDKLSGVNTMMINKTCHNLTKVTGIKPQNADKKTCMSCSNKKKAGRSSSGISYSRHLFSSVQFKQNTNSCCRR